MLKRYWIIIDPELRYGPGNIGVSAFSTSQAISLVKKDLIIAEWNTRLEDELVNAEVIEGIDVRKLDGGHVIPNMGVVSRFGIWFPNLNS